MLCILCAWHGNAQLHLGSIGDNVTLAMIFDTPYPVHLSHPNIPNRIVIG